MSRSKASARLIGALLAVAVVTSISIRPVHADEGWVITSFHSDIDVASDSTLTVVEDVKVDFGLQQKHGIFRTIPLRYHFSDTEDRYYNLSVLSVTNGLEPVTYDAYVDSDNQVIKIGDPGTLVTGPQRYVITYSVFGAVNSFSDHDEVFWNVDGALWPVGKQSVTSTVHLPAGSFLKADCFQGIPGSTEKCEFTQTGDTVQFTATRALASGEEMSVVAAMTPGAITVPAPLLEPRARQFPQDAFDINPLTVGLALLVLIGGVGLVVWNWLAHGRDREYLTQFYLTKDPRERPAPLGGHEPVVVEFEPPEGMRPAELGLILDETADPKDVTATIVDLAVRGYMTISEIPDWSDWKFTWKGGDAAALMPYEKTLLDAMFAGRTEVKVSELHGSFAPTLAKAEREIYSDSVTRRLFSSNPQQARASWGCLGVAIVVAGCALAVSLGLSFGWGLVGAAVAITGVVMTVSFPFMPQRTAAGRELMQRTLGFRLYMTTAEKYRQQFAAKAGIFTRLLPYAIVFGCVSLWAKAFEGIDTTATNTWYTGTTPFQAALLASSLESMNSDLSRAISYTPPSSGSASGFSSGGGFSGGGGGGGGGGSW
jgi:uncharacterized membrane protein YgcG